MITHETSSGSISIEITYFGEDEPRVVVRTPPRSPIEINIQLIDGEEARWLFLEHAGVKIYHTERFQDLPSDFYYSTIRGIESESENAFDARDLESIPAEKESYYEGLYSGNDQKQAIAYAIDQGKLTEEGLQ